MPDKIPVRDDQDNNQSWFWTDEWQAMEQEAEEDLRLGRYKDFDTIEEFLESLCSPVEAHDYI